MAGWAQTLDQRIAAPATDDDPDHIGHGYRYQELREIALMAARAWRYPRIASYDDRREWAFDGIIDLVLTATTYPTVSDLVRAGNDGIRRQVYAVSRMNGRPDRGDQQPGRNFVIFWYTPHQEVPVDAIVERIALKQVWPLLTPLERLTLNTLAACDFSTPKAAHYLGIPQSTFSQRVMRARRRFAEAWYWPDRPPAFRRAHQVFDTDQRRATRRRTMLASLCKRNHGWDCGCHYADRLEGD